MSWNHRKKYKNQGKVYKYQIIFVIEKSALVFDECSHNRGILSKTLSKVSCCKEAHASLSFSHKSPEDVGQDVLIFRSRSSHWSSIRLRLPLNYLKRLDCVSLWAKYIIFEKKLLDKYSYLFSNPNEVFPKIWPAVNEVWQESNKTSNTVSDRLHRILSSRTNCQPVFLT